MKKGFTLIEIIVCIVLITLIASITIISTNYNKDKDLIKMLTDAALLYIDVENDENGNNYQKEIISGRLGLKLPIKELVNKGYIKEEVEENIYKTNNLESDKDYYILLVQGGEKEDDYCETGLIQAIPSWTADNKPIYLCTKKETSIKPDDNLTVRYEVDLTKTAISKESYDELTLADKDKYFTYKENGEYILYDEDEKVLYKYYRGAVENNYVEFGEKDGNKLRWRIVWVKDKDEANQDGYEEMKLVLDDTIPMEIDSSEEKITIEENDTLYYYGSGRGTECMFLVGKDKYTSFPFDLKDAKYYNCDSNKNGTRVSHTIDHVLFERFVEDTNYNRGLDSADNLHRYILMSWYDKTNLKDYNTNEKNYLLENHCVNAGNYLNYNFCYNNKGGNELSQGTLGLPISLLNMTELVRGGYYYHEGNYNRPKFENMNIDNVDNYLYNGEKHLIFNTTYGHSGYNTYIINVGTYLIDNSIINNYPVKPSPHSDDKYLYYYIFNINGSEKYRIQKEYLTNLFTYTFNVSNLKPVIKIDLEKVKLINGEGSYDNPYKLVEK